MIYWQEYKVSDLKQLVARLLEDLVQRKNIVWLRHLGDVVEEVAVALGERSSALVRDAPKPHRLGRQVLLIHRIAVGFVRAGRPVGEKRKNCVWVGQINLGIFVI